MKPALCLRPFVIGKELGPAWVADRVLHRELWSALPYQPRGDREHMPACQLMLGGFYRTLLVDQADPTAWGKPDFHNLGRQFSAAKLKLTGECRFIFGWSHFRKGIKSGRA